MKEKIVLLLVMFLAIGFPLLSQDLTGVKICISPGHGGHESDDRRVDLGNGIIYWESDCNWEVAVMICPMLEDLGASVKCTRSLLSNEYGSGTDQNGDPYDPDLSERVATANAFEADFYHSNHTNAAGGMYTLLLYHGSNNNATHPGAKKMGDIMGEEIQEVVRTTSWQNQADNDFLGFHLGEINNTDMPATLSEASFHDVIPEGRRLMNREYRKLIVWSMLKSFLEYFEEPGFPIGEIEGIVSDESDSVLNGVKVTLEPGGKVYTGDNYYNGIYMFDSLSPGICTLTYSKTGYMPVVKQISVDSNTTTRQDIVLEESTDIISQACGQSHMGMIIDFTWKTSIPGSSIRFIVPTAGNGWRVTIDIYNMSGRRIRTLCNQFRDTGKYTIRWDGTNKHNMPISNGVYYSVMTVDNNGGERFTQRNKMIIQ